MTETSDHPMPTPANENNDPLLRIDTGLDELYRLRGLMLNRDMNSFTLEQWRRHRNVLERADKVIELYLSYL